MTDGKENPETDCSRHGVKGITLHPDNNDTLIALQARHLSGVFAFSQSITIAIAQLAYAAGPR